jgi:hypothetical protein
MGKICSSDSTPVTNLGDDIHRKIVAAPPASPTAPTSTVTDDQERRDNTRLTVTACHWPPAGVGTFRAFSSAAIAR